MMDESVLLKRLQAREYLALDRAIEIYTPYLSTVLYNVAGVALSKEDMEENISDVFVTLWTHAKNIDLNKRPVALDLTICHLTLFRPYG